MYYRCNFPLPFRCIMLAALQVSSDCSQNTTLPWIFSRFSCISHILVSLNSDPNCKFIQNIIFTEQLCVPSWEGEDPNHFHHPQPWDQLTGNLSEVLSKVILEFRQISQKPRCFNWNVQAQWMGTLPEFLCLQVTSPQAGSLSWLFLLLHFFYMIFNQFSCEFTTTAFLLLYMLTAVIPDHLHQQQTQIPPVLCLQHQE